MSACSSENKHTPTSMAARILPEGEKQWNIGVAMRILSFSVASIAPAWATELLTRKYLSFTFRCPEGTDVNRITSESVSCTSDFAASQILLLNCIPALYQIVQRENSLAANRLLCIYPECTSPCDLLSCKILKSHRLPKVYIGTSSKKLSDISIHC